MQPYRNLSTACFVDFLCSRPRTPSHQSLITILINNLCAQPPLVGPVRQRRASAEKPIFVFLITGGIRIPAQGPPGLRTAERRRQRQPGFRLLGGAERRGLTFLSAAWLPRARRPPKKSRPFCLAERWWRDDAIVPMSRHRATGPGMACAPVSGFREGGPPQAQATRDRSWPRRLSGSSPL